MPSHPWVSAHLFHHGDLDQVLIDLIAPLTAELRDRRMADLTFFLRYWDGGPHIRFRVSPRDPTADAGVRELIARRAAKYFARHPSPDRLTQEDYQRSARVLGAREGVVPVEHLYPNNAAVFLPYEPEHRRYGTGESIAAVERHFTDSSRLALTAVVDGATPEQRATAVLCFMALAWMLTSPDLRCTAQRQLEVHGTSSSEAIYRRQQGRLRTLVEAMRKTHSGWGSLPEGSNLKIWAASLNRMTAALRTGDETPSAERVADLCAHLFANRIGVQIDAERSLRHLTARAIVDSTFWESK